MAGVGHLSLSWYPKCRRFESYPRYHSDNGSEFTTQAVRDWLGRLDVKTLFIEPGSPWENGYIESFNGRLRNELRNVEIFDTLLNAGILTERWHREYNTIRPHSALGYVPPAPEARQSWSSNRKGAHTSEFALGLT